MNKYILIVCMIFLISGVFALSSISSPSVCCEQTNDGGVCINSVSQGDCNSQFQMVPTSCETTSFCKLGTCYESKEGMCMENVPMKVCQEKGGTWSEKKASELAVCSLGCCILSDQAAFVTMTRCKSLSTFYGIEIDFSASITSETACIEKANAQDEGACVYYQDTVRTCKFTTRKECGGSTSTVMLNATVFEDQSGKRFYKDVLCSAEELGTINARQVSTGCYEGKVYWFDSEGQRENVYFSDSEKSWNRGRVADPDAICPESSDSKTCGNCDYLLGSRCSQWDSILGIGKPKNVDHYCKTTKCTDRDGNTRMNGESWCVYDGAVGDGTEKAGSRHYREICADGEVVVEACEDFRNQICMHSGIASSGGEYSVAACRVNRWQDCTSQAKKDDCENTDIRDCLWVEPVYGISFGVKEKSSTSSAFSNPTAPTKSTSTTSDAVGAIGTTAGAISAFKGSTPEESSSGVSAAAIFPLWSATGNAIKHIVGSGVGQWEQNSLNNNLRVNRTSKEEGLCVPMTSPGLEYWTDGDASSVCAQSSGVCNIVVSIKEKYESVILGTFGDKDKEYSIYLQLENGTLVPVEDVDPDESCIKVTDKSKGEFEVNPGWAMRANAICSAMGDCGADFNFNGVFNDDGYEWKYKNESYYFTQADLGSTSSTKLGVGTGEVIGVDYIINDKYKLEQDDYVYVKQ